MSAFGTSFFFDDVRLGNLPFIGWNLAITAGLTSFIALATLGGEEKGAWLRHSFFFIPVLLWVPILAGGGTYALTRPGPEPVSSAAVQPKSAATVSRAKAKAKPAVKNPIPKKKNVAVAKRIWLGEKGELSAMPCPTKDPALSPWCEAVEGWDKATPSKLPPGGVTMVGLSIALNKNTDPKNPLARPSKISLLVLNNRTDTPTAQVTSIVGETKKETKELEAIRQSLLPALAGKGRRPKIDPEIAAYLKSLPDGTKSKVTKKNAAWVFEEPRHTEFRKLQSKHV
jgi:hypothetical protein